MNKVELLREALEALLEEANEGIATCPLTRERAALALAATASPNEAAAWDHGCAARKGEKIRLSIGERCGACKRKVMK